MVLVLKALRSFNALEAWHKKTRVAFIKRTQKRLLVKVQPSYSRRPQCFFWLFFFWGGRVVVCLVG